jgi:hypothetical protein
MTFRAAVFKATEPLLQGLHDGGDVSEETALPQLKEKTIEALEQHVRSFVDGAHLNESIAHDSSVVGGSGTVEDAPWLEEIRKTIDRRRDKEWAELADQQFAQLAASQVGDGEDQLQLEEASQRGVRCIV